MQDDGRHPADRSSMPKNPLGDRNKPQARVDGTRHATDSAQRLRKLMEEHTALRNNLESAEHARRLAEQARREWVTALDALQDPVFIHDAQLRVVRANTAYARHAGMDIRETIGRHYWEIFPKTGRPLDGCNSAMEQTQCTEEIVRLDSGEEFISRAHPVYDADGTYLNSLHFLQDVTEQRKAEAEQRVLGEALRQAAEAVVVVDRDLRITFLNPAFYAQFGYAPEEILGKPVSVLAVEGQVDDLQPEGVIRQLHERERWQGEVVRRARDGGKIPIHMSAAAIRAADGAITGYIANYLDLRELQRAERALRDSERHYRALTENISDLITLIDRDAVMRYQSPSVERLIGFDRDELIGHNIFELIHPEDAPRVEAVLQEALRTPGAVHSVDFRIRRKDGVYRYFESMGRNLLDDPSVAGVIVTSRDITERKEYEASLRKVNRTLKVLVAGNAVLMHATNEQHLLSEVCRTIVDVGGYRIAWVGSAAPDTGTIRAEAVAGIERTALETYCLSAGDRDTAPDPAMTALRSGQIQIVQDIQAAALPASFQELLRQHGIASAIYLPLHENGKSLAVLGICAQDYNAFDREEISLLEELANDLAYGIRALHVRTQRDRALAQHHRSLKQLRDNMEDTIAAIATTVEIRDPYTAGHERRVAALATTIARTMSLPKPQIEGIHFGALIHDLGKIRVPAEILSKPGRLSGLEFELIKCHSQTGYDILKGIKFPWPVASMVLQHHERIDGSGYPNGLRNGEILLESKILAVADTVEAMASHRPYRVALGVDAALDQIRMMRGQLFDPEVVDACLQVFAGGTFQFPSAG